VTSLFSSPSESLNPEQRAAVEHVAGPMLVLAGAGSGKTRVLTARVARLIQEHGVLPERILAVTFTNKAAGEMRERIHRHLGEEPRGSWIGTFHSLGARLLRRHSDHLGWDPTFTIFDAEESLREIRRIMDRLGVDPKRWNPKAVRALISETKNQLVGPAEFVQQHGDSFDLFLRTVARIYPEYQQSLRDQNAFDFDDLLVKPVELFEAAPSVLERYQERFSFLLVDEFQDTNHTQFRFLEAIARRHRNLMVVGDDDQSIYGWRGADIRNILDFEETYPGAAVVRLEQNYRSTGTILAAANRVIERNRDRKAKVLRTTREAGVAIGVLEAADERDEAGWLADQVERLVEDGAAGSYRDVAILYRTNAQSRALEDAFRRKGIPYQIVGGVRFYERREIQDLLGYLRLLSNRADSAAFERVVNLPRRGVGETSLEKLRGWAREAGIPLLDAAHRAGEVTGISAGAVRGLQRFAALIGEFTERARHLPVGPLLEELIEALDFHALLREEGPEGEERVENVKELVAGAMDFEDRLLEATEGEEVETLTELDLFLQQVALVTDIDRHDPATDAVKLMTLHNAKGLEYPTVFLAGMEEGLFPLLRSYEDPGKLEEERRLFYVGITRARDRLGITWARERRRGGGFMAGRRSSFVDDIPRELMEVHSTPRIERERSSLGLRGGGGAFGRGSAGTTGGGGGFGGRAPAPDDPRSAREAEERAFEAGLNQDQPTLRRGVRVVHRSFGAGTITEVSGFGEDLRVTVNFDGVGAKRLLARYAGLEQEF